MLEMEIISSALGPGHGRKAGKKSVDMRDLSVFLGDSLVFSVCTMHTIAIVPPAVTAMSLLSNSLTATLDVSHS